MADDESVNLVNRWRAGDQLAAAELFRRFADQLLLVARRQLSPKLSRRIDPEDVVQSACRSFFVGARDGRFTVRQGGDLWQLLVVITLHKLQHQVRRNLAGKRSLDREQAPGDSGVHGIEPSVLAREPSPAEAVALADQLEQFMRRLGVRDRRILELRLQGYNLGEIATETRRSERTVSRALDRIKEALDEARQDLSACGSREA